MEVVFQGVKEGRGDQVPKKPAGGHFSRLAGQRVQAPSAGGRREPRARPLGLGSSVRGPLDRC